MSETHQPKTPSRWWWLGHFFFWVITGLVCYVLYKESNPQAAKRHLIHSIWFPIVAWVAVYAAIIASLGA